MVGRRLLITHLRFGPQRERREFTPQKFEDQSGHDSLALVGPSMCKHVNIADEMRKGIALELPEPPALALRPARFETLVDGGGISNIGLQLYAEMLSLGGNAKIGTMVAGNSGRPGGACGCADGTAGLLHAGHYTRKMIDPATTLPCMVVSTS